MRNRKEIASGCKLMHYVSVVIVTVADEDVLALPLTGPPHFFYTNMDSPTPCTEESPVEHFHGAFEPMVNAFSVAPFWVKPSAGSRLPLTTKAVASCSFLRPDVRCGWVASTPRARRRRGIGLHLSLIGWYLMSMDEHSAVLHGEGK
jgi:hypothetical protein